MRMVASDLVAWDALGEAIVYALVSGVGITILFSFAVLGWSRAGDAQRDGDALRRVAWGTLGFVGLAGCLAAVALGLYVITDKD